MLIAGITFAAAAIVIFLVLRPSTSTVAGAAAPSDCLASWNESGTEFGRHLATDPMHDYSEAQVARIDAEGRLVEDAGEGSCVVVFPSRSLDPEPDAGAQVYGPGGWRGLNEQLELDQVLTLQQQAAVAVNADLRTDGTLEAR